MIFIHFFVSVHERQKRNDLVQLRSPKFHQTNMPSPHLSWTVAHKRDIAFYDVAVQISISINQ